MVCDWFVVVVGLWLICGLFVVGLWLRDHRIVSQLVVVFSTYVYPFSCWSSRSATVPVVLPSRYS